LTYLISNPPYPPETFGNLLLLHCKYQNYEVAAGLLAENSHLTYKYLTQVGKDAIIEYSASYLTCYRKELYDYLDASIMVPTAPEEAYRKFDELSAKYIEQLRKLTKQIQVSRSLQNLFVVT
jgi:tetratricopeptide repeat protein 30